MVEQEIYIYNLTCNNNLYNEKAWDWNEILNRKQNSTAVSK